MAPNSDLSAGGFVGFPRGRSNRKLRFKVSCRDEFDLIGEGIHERAIVAART